LTLPDFRRTLDVMASRKKQLSLKRKSSDQTNPLPNIYAQEQAAGQCP
jgi:hypothetical protein